MPASLGERQSEGRWRRSSPGRGSLQVASANPAQPVCRLPRSAVPCSRLPRLWRWSLPATTPWRSSLPAASTAACRASSTSSATRREREANPTNHVCRSLFASHHASRSSHTGVAWQLGRVGERQPWQVDDGVLPASGKANPARTMAIDVLPLPRQPFPVHFYHGCRSSLTAVEARQLGSTLPHLSERLP